MTFESAATHHEAGFIALVAAGALFVLGACGASAASGSLGAVLGRDNDTGALYVRDVPEGLGADLAGLVPGDEIVMIDGYYVRDLDKRAITQRLRGDAGTNVDLTVLRADAVHRIRVKRTPLRERDEGELRPKEEAVEP